MKYPIDMVITWVDGNNAEWKQKKASFSNYAHATIEADCSEERFRDWSNLQYILRGVEKYMPWVRKVHLIVDHQVPSWMKLDCAKLNIVKHGDFIPSKYLPTFNSAAIEANLHRIKGLSEHFIYFNDDCFILRSAEPKDFFMNGCPREQATFWRITSPDYRIPSWHIQLNCIGAINKNFDKKTVMHENKKILSPRNGMLSLVSCCLLLPYKYFPGFLMVHGPSSLLKSTIQKAWDAEPELMDATSSHKFRHVTDVSQYLFRMWQIVDGNFEPKNMLKTTHNFLKDEMESGTCADAIRKQKYQMVCIGDFSGFADFNKTKNDINSSLEYVLPNKSECEL